MSVATFVMAGLMLLATLAGALVSKGEAFGLVLTGLVAATAGILMSSVENRAVDRPQSDCCLGGRNLLDYLNMVDAEGVLHDTHLYIANPAIQPMTGLFRCTLNGQPALVFEAGPTKENHGEDKQ